MEAIGTTWSALYRWNSPIGVFRVTIEPCQPPAGAIADGHHGEMLKVRIADGTSRGSTGFALRGELNAIPLVSAVQ